MTKEQMTKYYEIRYWLRGKIKSEVKKIEIPYYEDDSVRSIYFMILQKMKKTSKKYISKIEEYTVRNEEEYTTIVVEMIEKDYENPAYRNLIEFKEFEVDFEITLNILKGGRK